MKIGILNADELSPDIIDTYGDYGDMFVRLLQKTPIPFTFSFYQVTKETYPDDINDCDAYLITGSKTSVYDNEAWIFRLKEFIQQLHAKQKKLIGICFGHQLIAEALGGRVEKSKKGWGVGRISSQVSHKQAWMKPEKDTFSLLTSHQDQVTKLPEQSVCLASNKFCPISSFSINTSILTFQGHPEFTKDYLLTRLKFRRELIGEQTYQKALSSLMQQADDDVIANWIAEFIVI